MSKPWKRVRLRDVLEVFHGYAFPGEGMSKILTGKPIIVSIGNFNYTGGFRFQSTRVREFTGNYPKQFDLAPGDLLVAMTCQTPGGEILGLPGVLPDDGRVYLHNQRIGKVITRPECLSARFAYYCFLWSEVNRQLVTTASGTKILHTAPSRIGAVEVDLPPLEVQEAIANVLTALDDKIAVNDRIAETSRKLAIYIGQRLFLGVSGGEVLLGDHANIVKGLSYRSSDLDNGTYGLVSLKCVGRDGDFQPDGVKLYGGECKQAQVVDDGDIVVAQTDLTQRVEVIGRPVRVLNLDGFSKLVASLDLAIVRPRGSLSREVLLSLLSTEEFRDHALSYCNGTTVVHLGSKALPEFKFTMPKLDAVRGTTAEMATLLARSDEARRETRILTELRNKLLPKLMSGEIRVRDAEKVVEDVT